ncbi:MAG TPA: excinuclease ABC subunit UvrC [Candidatus Saccharimonadales bacterium]|nr:excinuclease ABC subunit UvrC [Candidatus Saccharimonadales bacterium]
MSIKEKLDNLPKNPGVYFYKNKSGEIIYIGKAAVLRNRVRQYFQKSRLRDTKTDALIADIADIDWTEVETELDAVFLEAEMIRRYMPKYNILLRDDKSFVYVRIDVKSPYPSLTFTRRPLDDKAEYFGPYLSKFTISQALRHLRKIFPYSTHTATNIPKRACLQAQIGLCPGLEANLTSLEEYRRNLRKLISYITGKRKKLIKEMEKEMKSYSKASEFEKAARLRDKISALKHLDSKIIFGDRENLDISKDHGLVELADMLNIKPPRRVEGYDISHMSGQDTVASMVVFVGGVPDKSQYRKFKSRIGGNDDFAHMHEVITRRFSETNIKKWGKPDLILIDGGKGQVSSALSALAATGHNIPLIGLAKRYEEVIIPVENSQYDIKVLSRSSDALKLLQRIRDESHRFAVGYHSVLKRGRQKASVLDDIPSIGDTTRKKLIRTFGSARAVLAADEAEIAKVVGKSKAKAIMGSQPR